jgi:hypothetical protein
MVGLSNASAWTHSSPIFMYLRNWSPGHNNNGSLNSNPFPSFHRCHACRVINESMMLSNRRSLTHVVYSDFGHLHMLEGLEWFWSNRNPRYVSL